MKTEPGGKTFSRRPRTGAIAAAAATAALVLAAAAWAGWEDQDNDGIDDTFERFFGLDTGVDDHAGDPDGDQLPNIGESLLGTDPFRADTDCDGWADNVDSNPVSRAFFPWGEPRFTRGETLTYTWPDWARAAWAHGGAWLPDEPWGWMPVAPGGRLLMHVDRALASNDLWLAVAMPGSQASFLSVGLLDTNLAAVAPPVGLGAAGVAPWFTNRLPLGSHPAASVVSLQSTQGTVHVAASLLYADADGDGLDDDQNAQLALEAAAAGAPGSLPPDVIPAAAVIGFETDEGYLAGPVAGQHGWTASGDARVASGVPGAIGGQCLLLKRATPEADLPVIVSRPVDGMATGGLVWVTMRLAAGANGARPPRGQLGSAAVSFDRDRVVAFDGVSGAWLQSAQTFPRAFTGGWVRVDIALDYAAKTYTVCCEGVATHRGLGFADPSLQRPQMLLFRNDAPSYACDAAMDDIRFATAEPPGLDFDGDGLSNELERALGTDPWLADSDGDGIPDNIEHSLGGDPLAASYDWDGDGLSNSDETGIYGTDPTVADSDGDGLPDLYLAADLAGADCFQTSGSWGVDGDALTGEEGRGQRAAWRLVLPRGGVHVLEMEIAGHAADNADFHLSLALDDAAAVASRAGPLPATNTVWRIQTPWLPAGTNLLRLVWIEPAPARRTLAIARIRCFGIDGPDPGGDGFESWHAAASAASDGDGDALPDDVEVGAARTAPTRLDSDGDGLWDGDERDVFKLDPRRSDSDGDGVPDAAVVGARRGVDTAARRVGHITVDFTESGGALVWPDSTAPSCHYEFTVATPGFHVLELAARNHVYDPPANALFDFRVALCGREVGAVRFIGDIDRPGRGRLTTPWLPAGAHRFGISWRNRVVQESRITRPALESIRLLAVGGADADGDGLQDWMEERLLASAADTDGDGLRDRDEVLVHGSNPLARDTDGDGLSDKEETAAGTDPLLADTDGDGLSDADELLGTGTDPLSPDFEGGWTPVVACSGSASVAHEGAWYVDGTNLFGRGRGWVEYEFTLPTSDLHILVVNASHGWWDNSCLPSSPLERSDLLVHVDGQFLGQSPLLAPAGTVGSSRLLLPFLKAGTHRLRLFWNAVDDRLNLRLHGLVIGAFGGADADGDGVRDWVAASAMRTHAVDAPAAVSHLSPVCVEGAARYPRFTTAASCSNSIPVLPGVAGRWYADLPLDPSGAPTPLALSFENGAATAAVATAWAPLDLLSATNDALVARLGDTLRFKAGSPGNDAPRAVAVLTNGLLRQTVDTSPGAIHDLTFDAPGLWRLVVASVGATNSLAIQVCAAPLPAANPACMLGRPRPWPLPGVAPDVVLQSDDGVDLAWDGTNATITVNRMYADHCVVARAGSAGPVLASRRIDHFWIQAAVDSFIRVLEVGSSSQVWENRMVSLGIPGSVEVELRIIIGGVTFDDLAVVRRLTSADIGAAGEYRFRMIRPDYISTSTCHTIKAYQDGILLGEAYYALTGLPEDLR